MSITKKIARLREEHWLEVNALLGKEAHDYEGRDLLVEAIKECADAYNYLHRWLIETGDEGVIDLVEEIAELGDRIAGRKGLGL